MKFFWTSNVTKLSKILKLRTSVYSAVYLCVFQRFVSVRYVLQIKSHSIFISSTLLKQSYFLNEINKVVVFIIKRAKNVEREDFGRGYWSEVTCDYILGRFFWAAFSKSTENIKLVQG